MQNNEKIGRFVPTSQYWPHLTLSPPQALGDDSMPDWQGLSYVGKVSQVK
jgi:hypothetical protein